MHNEALLLDSTRPVSTLNIDNGCPEHSSQGVPSSCQDLQWYVLRVTYSRELKIKALLDERGVRTFIPMVWRKKTASGKTERKLAGPAAYKYLDNPNQFYPPCELKYERWEKVNIPHDYVIDGEPNQNENNYE